MKNKNTNTIILLRHIRFWDLKSNSSTLFNQYKERYAEGMIELLKRVQYDSIEIYASPVLRTRITAEIIAEACDYPIDKIVYSNHLNTQDGINAEKLQYIHETIQTAHTKDRKLTIIVGHRELITDYHLFLSGKEIFRADSYSIDKQDIIYSASILKEYEVTKKSCSKHHNELYNYYFPKEGEGVIVQNCNELNRLVFQTKRIERFSFEE